jgi:hypothetical protein
MTDDQITMLSKGAAEYQRRHPDTSTRDGSTEPAGTAAAGRDAYTRRHGTAADRKA